MGTGLRGVDSRSRAKVRLCHLATSGILSTQPFRRTPQVIGGSVMRQSTTLASFTGACHCRTVRFRVEAAPTHLVRCNCSICAAKGSLLLPVGEVSSVQFDSGESELVSYRFNSETAEHLFCRRCGIHPVHRPRFDPSAWSVNARCLDGGLPDLPIEEFDGKNWEAAARSEGWSPS